MKEAFLILAVVFLIALLVTVLGLVIGSGFLLQGGGGGVLKSEDGGLSWVMAEEMSNKEITVLRLDADDPARVYAGTQRNGLWLSKDFGKTWKIFSTDNKMMGARIMDLIEEKPALNIVLAAAFYDKRGRILRVADDIYQELYFTPLSQYAIFGVKVNPTDSNIIWTISSDGGFYESRDSGVTWRAIYRFNDGLVSMTENPFVAGRLWVRTSKGKIFSTTDAGRSWRDLSEGLKKYRGAKDIESLVFSPRDGALYLGSAYGLLRSYDGGISWHEVKTIIPAEALPITAIAIDPQDSDKIFAAAANQMYISDDRGVTWRGIILPTNKRASSIVIDRENGNNVYVGLNNR